VNKPERERITMKPDFRKAAVLAICFGFLLFHIPASGANFPAKPINLINPWLPGGDLSGVYRTLGERAGRILGQPVIVDDKPGATGTLAISTMMATAKPDGYTICHYHRNIIRYGLIGQLTYDPIADFTFILQLSKYTIGIAVRADAPWKTFKELTDYAKANPNKIKYATAGQWSLGHCYMELITRDHGVKWIHVPQKGGLECITSLLGGHVDFLVNPIQWRSQLDAGQLRTLATFTEKRTKWWPDVPTLKESGYNYVIYSPIGLAGPKGIDPKTVKVLHDAFKQSMEDPAFQKMSDFYAHEIYYLNSQDYEKSIKNLLIDERGIVEKFGLKEIMGKRKK